MSTAHPTFSSFSYDPAARAVRYKFTPDDAPRALRVCTDGAVQVLAVGSLELPFFYRLDDIVQGLAEDAHILNGPLPAEHQNSTPDFLSRTPTDQCDLMLELAFGLPVRLITSHAGSEEALHAAASAAAAHGFIVGRADLAGALYDSIKLKQHEEQCANTPALGTIMTATLRPADAVVPAPPLAANGATPAVGEVFTVAPETLDRIVNGTPNAPRVERTSWPFKSMQVGEAVLVEAEDCRRAQVAAHVYAKRTGKKFHTKLDRDTGVMMVTRIG